MDAATVKAYDLHAAEFAERYAQADVTALQQLLLRYLTPGCRVLEVGCGSGREAVFLAENGFAVTATDASAEMLAAARKAWPTLAHGPETGPPYPPGFRLLPAAFPLPADAPLLRERFDAVVVLAVVMHVPDQDLFEFAYQVRGLLGKGGTFILSTCTNRSGLDPDDRDAAGRLFRDRPPGELTLLFERLGFHLLARHDAEDGLARPGICWHTLVFCLDAAAGDRPVDQIETIINRDKKDTTYKLALLRALCEVAQNHYHLVQWHLDGTVSVPLGLLAEKWLYYYWPLIDTGELLIPQKRGLEKNKPITFRRAVSDLATHFRQSGGLSAFHAAYQAEALDNTARRLTDSALNKIANTIVVGPVTFASQGDFSMSGHRTARHRCVTPTSVSAALGRVHFRADVWREFCLLGHWISEAILLRWAELTHEISERQIPVHLILEKLLVKPETEREVYAARELFKALTGLDCVWTGAPLAGGRFQVDHVIPFTLWHNNDLWNLVPAACWVNNEKRDRLVTRDLLLRSQDRIIGYWQKHREQRPQRFDIEINRTLLGRNYAETNWQKPAFAALVEAVETLALQRGLERWAPGTRVARSRRVRAATPSATLVPALAILPFQDLGPDEPFRTALPVVASLAAGPLTAGFQALSLETPSDYDWVRVPAEIAKPRRFVVCITGNSMAPTLHPGDLVVFEYHRTPRRDGDVVIVADFSAAEASGECAVKRFRTDPVDWLFSSDNRDYPAIRFTRVAQDYPILGVMVARLSADA